MSKKSNLAFAILTIICIIIIIVIGINKSNKKIKVINNIVTTVLNSKSDVMLYLGSSNCSACDLEASQMSLLLNNYSFNYYYIDTNNITTQSDKNSIYEKLGLSITKGVTTPSVIIYKNGKIVDQIDGLTNADKIFNLLQDNGIIKSTYTLPVSYLSLSSYIDLLKKSGKQIIALTGYNTEDGSSFQTIMWDLAKKYSLNINMVDLNDFSTDEGQTFEKQLSFYDDTSATVPTLLIVEDGKVVDSLVDLSSSDDYITMLKKDGFIE